MSRQLAYCSHNERREARRIHEKDCYYWWCGPQLWGPRGMGPSFEKRKLIVVSPFLFQQQLLALLEDWIAVLLPVYVHPVCFLYINNVRQSLAPCALLR